MDIGEKDRLRRILLLLAGTAVAITGIVVNSTSYEPLYNEDLLQVPKLQASSTEALIWFMNLISNIFNPLVCAGYIIGFYLFSYRKLEILAFLVWFIFLSFLLSMLKMAYQQARPYWIAASGVQMLQWTCYTEFGCPSGHAMLGLVLMEFVIRFISRANATAYKLIYFLYSLLVVLQLTVMFSRVILGMHSYNQVLYGALLGLYSFVPYYLYVQKLLLKWILALRFGMEKFQAMSILIGIGLGSMLLEALLVFVPSYDTRAYWVVISNNPDCKNSNLAKSFQYKCFEDSAIFMAGLAVVAAFVYTEDPSSLTKMLSYPRISLNFLKKILLSVCISIIPVLLFLNPWWADIEISTAGLAILLWLCNTFAFILAIPLLVTVSPILCAKINLQTYITPQSIDEFTTFQTSSGGPACLDGNARKNTEMNGIKSGSSKDVAQPI